MTTPLPLRIRQHIRDYIELDTSPTAKKLASASSTLGIKFVFAPEWAPLWSELQSFYPENDKFVPNVSRVVGGWCDAFVAWCEDEGNEKRVDRLLEELSGKSVLTLLLEIDYEAKEPTTAWLPVRKAFAIKLPKAALLPSANAELFFTEDFANLFAPNKEVPTSTSAATATAIEANNEDWDEIVPESTKAPAKSLPVRSAAPRPLPDLALLERPDLMMSHPPYWLIVRQETQRIVSVQCTHQESLMLLEQYLKKWVRHLPNMSERLPCVNIELQGSTFGISSMVDTLVLEGKGHLKVNPTLVLSFVQRVLEFEMVERSSVAGTAWEFRRTTPFK